MTLRMILGAAPHGAALVEFALLAPFLILLLVGIADFGLAFYWMMEVEAAAEAGAQYAANHYPNGSWNQTAVNNIKAAVTSAVANGASSIIASPDPTTVCGCAASSSFTQASCGSTCASGSRPGLYALVSAQLSFSTVLPYPSLPNPLTLSGQAYRRLQ